MSTHEHEQLLKILQERFVKNPQRHKGMDWSTILQRLLIEPEKIHILHQMEQTGGEPDVVVLEAGAEPVFIDCSAESPKGRRSLCYDRAALEDRKELKPVDSALDVAGNMCIQLLTEEQYRQLQTIEPFDTKTSSWILTPGNIRKKGGALFCDRRYDTVFVYHNGAGSYYAARGFRGSLVI